METTLQPHAPAGSTDDLAPGSGHGSPHRTWLSLAVSEGSRWLVVAFTVTLLLIINYEVFARYLFNAPTVWVTEYSTYLVAAMAFLGAAFAVVRDSHIRVTLLLDAVSGARRRRLDQLSAATALLVTLVLAWKSLEFVHGEFTAGTRDFGLMATPMWVPQSVVALGYLGLLLALALQVHHLGGRVGGWRCAPGVVALVLATTVLYGHALGLLPLSPWWGLGGCVAAVLVAVVAWDGWAGVARWLGFACVPVAAYAWSADAPLLWQAMALVLTMLYLLFAGVRVAFVLTLSGLLGVVFWLPSPMLRVLAERSWSAVHTFELSAIPMFVLMGALLVKSEASGDMFAAMRALMGRVRGGFAFASIGAAGIFAAVSGSSLATAATLGRVAGPQMLDHGYDVRLAYGVLAAGGTLGIMIPPSIAMIVYGSLAGVPVTQLFMAGIVPGVVLMGLFALVVWGWLLVRPQAAPPARAYSWREKLDSLKGVIPFMALMACVLGALYFGVATPTEVGAVGALAALGLCHWRRTLDWRALVESLEETALVTSFLLLIAVGAAQMGYVVDYLGMPGQLVAYIRGQGLLGGELLAWVVVVYLVLGMFIEPISMVLMTMPVMLPLIQAVGWDPLWFGIVLVLLVEVGLITAPVGMILFVLEGVAKGRAQLKDISVGALPFVVVMLAAVALFYWVPGLVTGLPNLMVAT